MSEVVQLAPSPRRLSSWVDGFIEYTNGLQSPPIFRRWTAILAIAGAIEQKVSIRSLGKILYPNLYCFLVGPPGAGKSLSLNELEDIWPELEGPIKAPTSLTKPALVDALAAATRVTPDQVGSEPFNSLMIAVGELGALIPGYDSDFLNALTYFYDTRPYGEKRRSIQNELNIARPQINMLACCTPSFLVSLMPMSAWEQGFLSRVIIVYSDISDLKPLNLLSKETRRDINLRRALVADLQIIAAQYKHLEFTQGASDCIEAWHMSRKVHEPSHPRLQHYSSRRTSHLLKLSVIASMDKSNTNEISLEAVQTAQEWLAEAEFHMEDIFKVMSSGGDAQVITELYHFIRKYVNREKHKCIPSSLVHSFLINRAPVHSHQNIINMMIRANTIKTDLQDGIQVYKVAGDLPPLL